ncbi:type II toxin-antitoxin system death-on-curing family toxin [Actinomyces minihominis]|uniref:type II toxin-antitoxin system death-on-curing family toxin n=1 Tax=Actinomyces minihominis TaxID=2002838 RepID=UPI001F5CD528|nr:type II toxin-antitoxin system death-on-curing family toxin [Actinomyces minihominis]
MTVSLWWPRTEDIQEWLQRQGFFSRDWGLLASALDRPLTVIAGQEMYPTFWFKLAALLDSIQRNHPLLDGNKRLGFLLVALILQANGFDDSTVSDDEWYDLIIEVASTRMDTNQLAQRLEGMLNSP